jgi:multicomponent Na+:H+ antiporter subunit E
MRDPSRRRHCQAALLRTVLFAGIWLIFTGADPSSWIIGVPTLMLATAASLELTPPSQRRLSLFRLTSLMPWFVWESVRGGFDVAARILRPRMRIDPGFQTYLVHRTGAQSQVLLADVVSLLPGTLSADLKENGLLVHALDRGIDLDGVIGRVEQRLAAAVGEDR